MNSVEDFKVEEEIFSDHMPLKVNCNFTYQPTKNSSNMNLMPKLRWDPRRELQYKKKLDKNIDLCAAGEFSTENGMNALSSCIKNACRSQEVRKRRTKYKSQWFDQECESMRRKSFLCLRKARSSDCPSDWGHYQNANKNFKILCETKKSAYYNRLAKDLGKIKDSKAFWGQVRKLNGISPYRTAEIGADELANHFESLLCDQQSESVSHALNHYDVEELDREVTEEEVKNALARAKVNKAAGEDRIPAEFLKYSTPKFVKKMTAAFNYLLNTGKMPACFKKTVIFPIHKKGNRSMAENYRGISFQNASAKVFAAIILQRLTDWVERNNILTESQAGFRRNYSTVDNIYCLSNIAQDFIANHKKLYVCFVDLKAAFDTINRIALMLKLNNIGVSSKL